MTLMDIIHQTESLSLSDKVIVIRRWMETMDDGGGGHRKTVQRLLRRLENPDIPGGVFRAMEDVEDGRTVSMVTAMSQKPPC
jgi:hypothetical protein